MTTMKNERIEKAGYRMLSRALQALLTRPGAVLPADRQEKLEAAAGDWIPAGKVVLPPAQKGRKNKRQPWNR